MMSRSSTNRRPPFASGCHEQAPCTLCCSSPHSARSARRRGLPGRSDSFSGRHGRRIRAGVDKLPSVTINGRKGERDARAYALDAGFDEGLSRRQLQVRKP